MIVSIKFHFSKITQSKEQQKEEPDEPPPVPPILVQKTHSGHVIKYKIEKKIGKGGFGSVYLALELNDNRPTAIKCVWKNHFSDKKLKQKLITEIEIHKSLSHPHIIDFLSFFQDSNYVYFALEFCSGGNVLELLKKDPPFSELKAAEIARQIIEALVYLHSRGIVHHDIKLQNFLIDEGGTVKLCDFGLSVKLYSKELKHSISGTPGYIAPEVLFTKNMPTPAIDVWSIGVAVFLMVTGKQPFQTKDKKETFARIKHVNYAWPPKPVVSETVKSFVTACLRKDPEERPTAANLLHLPFIQQVITVEKKSAQTMMMKLSTRNNQSSTHNENKNNDENSDDDAKNNNNSNNDNDKNDESKHQDKINESDIQNSNDHIKNHHHQNENHNHDENQSENDNNNDNTNENTNENINENINTSENENEHINEDQNDNEKEIEKLNIRNENANLNKNIHNPNYLVLNNEKQPGVRSIPRSVSFQTAMKHQEDHGEDPISLPNYTVRIWWDYTSKYGLAYILHNGTCGACFNDATRMVLDKNEKYIQYYGSQRQTKMDVIDLIAVNNYRSNHQDENGNIDDKDSTNDDDENLMRIIHDHSIMKKILLIQHFAKELKSRMDDKSDSFGVNDNAASPLIQNISPEDQPPLSNIKYWAKTQDGVLFRFANRDIQANFKDHTKLVIESQSKDLFYDDNNNPVIRLTLNDLADREKYRDVRKRFRIVKEMSNHFV